MSVRFFFFLMLFFFSFFGKASSSQMSHGAQAPKLELHPEVMLEIQRSFAKNFNTSSEVVATVLSDCFRCFSLSYEGGSYVLHPDPKKIPKFVNFLKKIICVALDPKDESDTSELLDNLFSSFDADQYYQELESKIRFKIQINFFPETNQASISFSNHDFSHFILNLFEGPLFFLRDLLFCSHDALWHIKNLREEDFEHVLLIPWKKNVLLLNLNFFASLSSSEDF